MQRFLRKLSWVVALAAVPTLLFLAGCDSDDNDEIDPVDPVDPAASANYDTTEVDGVPTIQIAESDGEGIMPVDGEGNFIGDGDENDVTWSSDYEYELVGRVFVNDGQTLTIEEGTVVRGDTEFSDPSEASALIVAQGGQLDAVGTADDPIIFTAEGQPIDSYDFGTDEQWGGIILLGTAENNVGSNGSGVINVEGIPSEVTRGRYGCGEDGIECDNGDDSGTLRYLSIRHGGASIGQGNEIQGLTLGSVGSGTDISYIEVMSNLDDGFEWFGGTVNATHLVTTFVGDDSFDIDQGYTGNLQYLLAVQGFTDSDGDHGGEHDSGNGDLSSEDAEPVADPQICNATYLGGADAPSPAGEYALYLRDNFAGDYYNSLFASFPDGFIEVEDLAGSDADSRGRFEAGELNIEGNVLTGLDAETFAETIVLTRDDDDNVIDESFRGELAEYLAETNSIDADVGISAWDGSGIDVFPSDDVGDAVDTGACLEDADYVGAFEDEDDNWIDGWTTLSAAGIVN